MPTSEFWALLILLTVIVLSTTANLALRDFSRSDLARELQKRGWLGRLEELNKRRQELLLSSSFIRMAAILGLVMVIAHLFGFRPREHSHFPYASIFLSSLLLIMVFAVAIPHAWARYRGEVFLAAGMPFLLVIGYLLQPIAMFLHLFDGLVRRLAGVPRVDEQESEVEQIEKEILEAVSEGEKTGAVAEEDANMIESVIALRDTTVAEIMTPRTEMVALPETATLFEAKEFISRHGHSRIPIYGENIDDLKGVLYAKDLLNLDESEPFDPTEVMRKVPFVPETKGVPDLLKELKEKKVHLAIVLDEYGGTAGLVTIEDIVEEIVGDIADEYELPEPAAVRRIDDNTIEIDARLHIDELNDELKIELPEDPNYDTVGGFLFSEMGKIPEPGEEFRYQNVKFHVLDAEERKINRVRVEVTPEQSSA